MKKIEYKDVDKIISEKNEIARICEILTTNLQRLKKFNRITRIIDETNVFDVSVANRDPDARRELLRVVSDAVPFGGIKDALEKVDEIIDVLTATDMVRRRSQYPQFGGLEPLISVIPPTIDGRKLRRSDFMIKNDKIIATNEVLTMIERSNLYCVENEVQEKVYTLAKTIAQNFQDLATIYTKHGKVLNRDVFMRQLFVLSGDLDDYRVDEKSLFVSILPLFK